MFDYQKQLLPQPQKITDGGGLLQTAEGFALSYPNANHPVLASAIELLTQALPAGSFPVAVQINSAIGKAESYRLCIEKERICLVGADAAGVFYGTQTLSKLLTVSGSTVTLPLTCIEDWPEFSERGLFLEDRYGSEFMTLADYEEAIDYFAEKKLNSLTIGVYGCWGVQYDNRIAEYLYLPVSKYPQLKSPMSVRYYRPETGDYENKDGLLPTMFEAPFFGDIVRYAARKNIRVRPLVNSYGHNTLIPRLIPEVSAKNEDGSPKHTGFCTRNPKTYEVLFDIYDEIIDRYLAPNGVDSFHIGLDEVKHSQLCQCEKCRGVSGYDLAMEHAIRLIRHLKEKGMRNVHIYYDTIFAFYRTAATSFLSLDGAPTTQEEVDAYVAKTAQRFRDEGVYDVTVLDWWNYSKDEDMFYGRELNSCFRSVMMPMTGYYHWLTPMERNNNIHGGGKRALKHGFEGLCAYSSLEFSFDRPYSYLASAAWNKAAIYDPEGFYDRYARDLCPQAHEDVKQALAIIGDLSIDDTRENPIGKLGYYWTSYKRLVKPYPRCWFAELKENIENAPEVFLPFLKQAQEEAAVAYGLLEKAPIRDQRIKKALLASAAHYKIHGQCYQILYALLSGQRTDYKPALEQVIGLYDQLLLIAKAARREYTYYHYARDLSIQRELCVNATQKLQQDPTLSLPDTERLGSERLTMLR